MKHAHCGTLLGLSLLLAPDLAAQATHDIGTSGINFVPANIAIEMGDTVRWTLSGMPHTATDKPNLGPKLFDSSPPAADIVFEFTYDEAAISKSPRIGGVYDYVCLPHEGFGMVGTVTVTDIPFVTDNIVVSASGGGSQNWSLNAGVANASLFYLVLGSAGGTSPGLPIDGVLLPLNFDNYMLFTLNGANNPPFSSTFGALDGAGKASASLTIPSGLSPNLVGTTLHHAFAAFDAFGSGKVEFTSNPVPVFFGS